MNRLGIMIDLSHLAVNGINDVLELSTQPVVASHSNSKTICAHERNLEDGQIKRIAASGGIFGVAFLGRLVDSEDPI